METEKLAHPSRNTTDIWLASFLKLKGFELYDFEVLRPRKVKYYFKITDSDYKKMKMSFLNHDIGSLKIIMEELKDLGF